MIDQIPDFVQISKVAPVQRERQVPIQKQRQDQVQKQSPIQKQRQDQIPKQTQFERQLTRTITRSEELGGMKLKRPEYKEAFLWHISDIRGWGIVSMKRI